MTGLAARYFGSAIVYAILGMILGLVMGITHDHTQMPTHAHILVVGWVAIADPAAGFINILASAITGSRTSWVSINTMAGLIWMTGLFLTPYVFLMVAAGFRNSDSAMEEAARVSGAGRWRLLATIILPLQRPALQEAFAGFAARIVEVHRAIVGAESI